MAEWSAWFDEVLPHVPGCPQPVATHAIRNAAIQFCEDSRVWQIDHPLIDSVADTAEYTLAPGDGKKVVRLEMVWYEGNPLDPITTADLEALYTGWTVETGEPKYFLQERLEALVLVPYPSAAVTDAIKAKVSVKPSRAATVIDDVIHERYLEQIGRGARSRLHLMQRKPWTDVNLGSALAQQFEDDIAAARFAAFKGHTRARNRSTRGHRRFV